ncbi:hypothetical protein TNIN_71901 [Trichonephila inaurata madagascariensis]|uniref:Uncharacterized protein n=1 Tax=Trichonephila inaurata madagascariensis TaxID=2747483 RepID=A0A8X7BPK5_9ARAC|nr:hypothetical protein TNIN_71901 [Trichonephila inaurata madagascariensis]
MARNERAGSCWSQPPRSTPAKSRPSCSRGLGSDNLDEIGDIVNALSYVLYMTPSLAVHIKKTFRDDDA